MINDKSDHNHPATIPETMEQYRHPSAVATIQDVCALRFLGYEYEETVSYSDRSANNLSVWSRSVCDSLTLHADPLKNCAAFFALQRFLGKWGGEYHTICAREHIAFDFLFLHLYAQDVPAEYQDADAMHRWGAFKSADIESAAAYIRNSFIRKHDFPDSLHEMIFRNSS